MIMRKAMLLKETKDKNIRSYEKKTIAEKCILSCA
jgi:hypothetical protein